MLRVVSVVVLLFAVQLVLSAPAEEDKFDNIDFDAILNNKRVLETYIKCLTDKGPCTAQGKELKRIVPEVIQTSCSKCNPKQKQRVRHIINTMQSKHKDQWDIVVNKYDPKKTRQAELKAFLNGN
ncbi:putative odorant-binding protein A10 [Lycorma delicatula]|uniref:putative odorant-binding protein A10 n=1 Tax=Lycorma delicatula TaxID=130591 RepID=UPI003F519727